MKKYGAFLFALILLLHCLFIYLGMNDLRNLSKFLLIPLLIVYLFAIAGEKAGPLVYCGLLFSFAGDLLLSRPGETFFLLGMLAFIGTHVCNSIYFFRLQKGQKGNANLVLVAIFLLAALSAFVFRLLQPHLGSFQWPILFYMFIISLMAVLATRSANNISIRDIAMRCFIPGAALFVLSDTTLAMNKFLLHEPLVDMAVMLTYGAAQYCLVRGFAKIPEFTTE
ncbi:MAG: lysoplasmalogenase [Sediminibacterium sp.]|nr:lysoplasmalogenase [Sediminibacterium sp.]